MDPDARKEEEPEALTISWMVTLQGLPWQGRRPLLSSATLRLGALSWAVWPG